MAVLLSASAGCSRCAADDQAAAPTTSPELPPVAGDASSGVDVPMPGAVYKEAYRRAREQVNTDNADERLDELERAIDREARELP